jgi:toxin ParE1/3/4
MTRYVLSPRAQRDIEDIWNYTVQRWGADQAERYVGDIARAIEIVSADRRRGRACDEIRAGYFKCQVGSHVVFYRRVKSTVAVVRILHQRMDFERHL